MCQCPQTMHTRHYLPRGRGGVHLPMHILIGMCHRKIKMGGSGTSWSVKTGVFGTHNWTLWNLLCWNKGVFGTRYCEKCARVAHGWAMAMNC